MYRASVEIQREGRDLAVRAPSLGAEMGGAYFGGFFFLGVGGAGTSSGTPSSSARLSIKETTQ